MPGIGVATGRQRKTHGRHGATHAGTGFKKEYRIMEDRNQNTKRA